MSLSAGTASTSWLEANSTGSSSFPSPASSSGIFVLAAASTSTGASWRICAASSSEPANCSFASGAHSVSAAWSEAAAETVSCDPPLPAASSSSSPQPAAARSGRTAARISA